MICLEEVPGSTTEVLVGQERCVESVGHAYARRISAALRRDLLFQGGSQAEILLPALGQARLVRRLVFFQGLFEVSSRLVEGPEIEQGLPVPRVDL